MLSDKLHGLSFIISALNANSDVAHADGRRSGINNFRPSKDTILTACHQQDTEQHNPGHGLPTLP